MDDATKTLFERYVDDRNDLSVDELARLLGALQTSELLRGRLRDQLIVDELLAQRVAIDRRDFPAQVRQRVRDYQKQQGLQQQFDGMQELASDEWDRWSSAGGRDSRATGRRWILAMTLVLFGLATGYFAYREYGPVASIDSIRGELVVIRDGMQTKAEPGAKLFAEDRLLMSGAGDWRIVFADGTRLAFRGASDLQLRGRGTGAKRVELSRGDLTADVRPQDQPMVFATPNAEATVLGTELFLWVGDDATRLDVAHGRVRLEAADRSAIVESQQYATVNASGLTSGEQRWPMGPEGAVLARRFHRQTRDDLFSIRGEVIAYNASYRLKGGAIMLSPEVSEEIVRRCQKANAFTLELWLRPTDTLQPSSARVFSLRSDQRLGALLSVEQNSLMFQMGSSSRELSRQAPIRIGNFSGDDWVHVLLAFGDRRLDAFVDGHLVKSWAWDGDLSTWEPGYLALGDDWNGDGSQAWSGHLGAAAVYARRLSQEEAYRHWRWLKDSQVKKTGGVAQ